MNRPKHVTYDVYVALLDSQGSLVPAVSNGLDLEADNAEAFLQLSRAKQMERTAISNSLVKGANIISRGDRDGLELCCRSPRPSN